MKHTAGGIAFRQDGVLMGEDGKCLITRQRPDKENRANRAHLCLCWNTHDELLGYVKLLASSVEYQIGKDVRAGDDEGARLKHATLKAVREAIARAEGK